MSYRPRYLSHSAIDCYATCPALYQRRYVHGVVDPPTPAMAFGKCFALALEALHRGQDGEVVWVRQYAALQQAGELPPGSPTIEHGLGLLALYRDGGIEQGEPEHRFEVWLPDRDSVPVPILGYMDILGPSHVVEFKTSSRQWTQGDVDSSYQAALYAYAYRQVTGRKPERVQFIIANTRRPEVYRLAAYPAGPELRLFELRAAMTWRGIRDEKFPAICQRPWCAACVEAGVVPVKTPRAAGLELQV